MYTLQMVSKPAISQPSTIHLYKYISLDSDAISTIYLKILAKKQHKEPFLSQVTAGKP